MTVHQPSPYEYVIGRRESGRREFVMPAKIEFHQKEFLGDNDARRERRPHCPERLGVQNVRKRLGKFQSAVESRIDDRHPIPISESQRDERRAVFVDLPFDHARHPFV